MGQQDGGSIPPASIFFREKPFGDNVEGLFAAPFGLESDLSFLRRLRQNRPLQK